MKKLIIPGVKDASGAYVKITPPEAPQPKKMRFPKASDISLDDLMDKHIQLLYRETRMLLEESSGGKKLSKDSAHSMRENMKLLVELRKREKELFDDLSTDELQKLLDKKNTDEQE